MLLHGDFMGEGSGYGKTILFGEHFVVYGLPAIASAISDKTTAIVERRENAGWELQDDRSATRGYKKEKLAQQKDSIERILKAAGFDAEKHGIKITLGGPSGLFAASGVGASAASCTAIARALSNEFELGFNDEKINALAYEGEKGYHGTPSGIDNTAATFGGLIWFRKPAGGSRGEMERIELMKPVEIVIGNTGMVADTKKAVAGVAERREKKQEKYSAIFSSYEELAFAARKALEDFDLEKVGELMEKNHELLQEIDVSCDKLDDLVDIALESGALGAKLTGGGLGGNIVALTPGKKLQEKVADALEKEGFNSVKTLIGV